MYYAIWRDFFRIFFMTKSSRQILQDTKIANSRMKTKWKEKVSVNWKVWNSKSGFQKSSKFQVRQNFICLIYFRVNFALKCYFTVIEKLFILLIFHVKKYRKIIVKYYQTILRQKSSKIRQIILKKFFVKNKKKIRQIFSNEINVKN